MAEKKETKTAEEMIEEAKELVEEEELSVFDQLIGKRTMGSGNREITHDESVPWPLEHLDPDRLAPSAYAAVVDDMGSNITERVFHLDPKKLKGLPFMPPGQPIPGKPLYTVKAIHKDGRIVQLPFEEQIQNTAGGDIADAIGLRRYQRKGIYLLFDFETFKTVYCPANECWAKANDDWENFCCPEHLRITVPGRRGDRDVRSALSQSATTSRTWAL